MKRLWALGALLPLSGCTTLGYYAQAVGGHLEVMRLAAPVEERLREPDTPEPLRAKLARALAIREFASRELALPDNGSYRRYADLGQPFVVWNVVAAPEFSVEPLESCFPFAGCVSYRGYYSEEAARAYAAALAEKGYDVHVGGVPAYSTLGWFDDPLLSTFIHYPEAELARIVFHELAHQVVYVKGDTMFNESFASTVEEEGVRRWLEREGTLAQRETPSWGDTAQGSPPSTSVPPRSRKNAPESSACSPSCRTNTGRSRSPGVGSPATTGCSRAERTTRCSLRSRATRSSFLRSARSLRKSGAILRPSMTQRAVWRDSRNPSATRVSPPSRHDKTGSPPALIPTPSPALREKGTNCSPLHAVERGRG